MYVKPSRNFVRPYPRQTPAEYTAESTVLDLSMNAGGGVIPELVGAYTGTIQGPAHKIGDSLYEYAERFSDNSDNLNLGDVTQLNSVSAFSGVYWIKKRGTGTPDMLWGKLSAYGVGNTGVNAETTAAADPCALLITNSNGASEWGSSPSFYRQGLWYHMAIVFDGSQADNAGRLKLYVDSVQQTLSFTGTIQATTPNLATENLYIGAGSAGAGALYHHPCVYSSFKLHSTPLTAAQVKSDYLKGAKRIVFSQTLEDAAGVGSYTGAGVGVQVGTSRWQATAGTWNLTPDVLPQRTWLACSGAGQAHVRLTKPTGTWVWRGKTAVGGYIYFVFTSNYHIPFGASQTGYYLAWSSDRVTLRRTAAGVDTNLFQSTAGSVPIGSTYEFCLARRFDGQMAVWARGGAYTVWTLLPASFGTNPVTDTNNFVGGYAIAFMSGGDKMGSLQVFEGYLDPTAGELPFVNEPIQG